MNKKYKNNELMKYIVKEKTMLILITITGIIYNIGMVASPYFEGRLAQCLADIYNNKAFVSDMVYLAVVYVLAVAIVQFARYLKRLYVRKFANNLNKEMKMTIFNAILSEDTRELKSQSKGSLMTKAISDVDGCVEGIRKFTTEVFDTGVVMIAYIIMLMIYDYRLALISIGFPPMAFLLAKKMKVKVTEATSLAKKSQGKLNQATIERISNSITYRAYGEEENQNLIYDGYLLDYEKKSIKANVLVNATAPVYQTIALISVIFIIYFGAKNVMGTGWREWDIASITTFLSCYLKLATKTGKSAKLFNAVQKARVSFDRIKPYLIDSTINEFTQEAYGGNLCFENIKLSYGDNLIFTLDNLKLNAGDIVGVTGEIASGKTSFGKMLLLENDFTGNIFYNNKKLGEALKPYEFVSYLGHDKELFTDTIKNNISFGDEKDVSSFITDVCLDVDLREFPDGENTIIGNNGYSLSGGQKARVALARALYHQKPVIVLDDPFSAVDMTTEKQIFQNLKEKYNESIIILISNRLSIFPKMNKVLWIDSNKKVVEISNHEKLFDKNEDYQKMYMLQSAGGNKNEQ